MADVIETIQGCRIQHGAFNDRIYLMKLNTPDVPGLITTLDDMARQYGYGKIFAKIPDHAWTPFSAAGYEIEAEVPGFFAGKADSLFIAKFFSRQRRLAPPFGIPPGSSQRQSRPYGTAGEPFNADAQRVTGCRPVQAEAMAAVYNQVFETYPQPIQDPSYLSYLMDKGVLYYGVHIHGNLVALAAADIESSSQTVEMTDFATLPHWRGRGLASLLLRHMDLQMRDLGVQTAYTIARAASAGMNAVFKHNDYRYGGRLRNNTQICGRIQCMDVWYKPLQVSAGIE